MAWTSRAILILGLAVLGPYLAERYQLVYLLYKNYPSWMETKIAFNNYKIKYLNELRNCEDVVLDERYGLAFLSCDPGRDRWNTVMGTFIDPYFNRGWIYTFDYNRDPLKSENLVPIEIEDFDHQKARGFHPLGLAFHADSRTLYVVNHGKGGPSIEIFNVDSEGTKLTWQKTVEHPLAHAPNSIAPISATEIYFSNDHKWVAEKHPFLSQFETLSAYPGGSLNYFNLKTNTVQKLYDLPFANGIALLNKTHLAVSSTTLPAVFIFSRVPGSTAVKLEKKIRTNFLPDNLHVDATGKLLIAGHPFGLALTKVAKTNYKYDLDNGAAMDPTMELLPEKDRPRAASWVAEWDGNEEGTLKDLYVSHEFGTSTSAARDTKRGVGIVTGLYEKGILVWKE